MEEVDDAELVVERVAALDLGKAGLEACVRVPHPQRPGRRMQELRGYGTTTAQLLAMVAWLRQWRVQRVVMESTSTYWKGVYYLLEAEEFDCRPRPPTAINPRPQFVFPREQRRAFSF
jgi:hypothetical protein